MKKLIIIILSVWANIIHSQIYFATIDAIAPDSTTNFLVGDGQNRAKKVSYSTLRSFLGVRPYPIKVSSVAPSNNPSQLRNKVVQTLDSMTYLVDFNGESIFLGYYGLQNNIVTITGSQTITGKKVFADTASFTKGLKSNSTIDTKGLNTEGGAGKIAMKTKGVVADADTIITTDNYVCDGTYGSIGVNTSGGNRTIKVSDANTLPNGALNIRKETSDTNTVTITDMSGTVIYILYSKLICRVKNNGTTWKKESVSIY